ncbi:MAG: pyruvate kinase [Candidatus Woesearchaeota archaeon]|nr:pyruvate kinase [Candidatus Woesearchaeota archaeon]
MDKFTKIVCTIGPASDSKEIIEKLYKAGMNIARLNFSHGSYEYFEKAIKNIRSVSDEIAILLDTKGPEIRTGEVENNHLELNENDKLIITKEQIIGNKEQISTDYSKIDKLEIGNTILIDDGLIECRVIENLKDAIKVKILNGGILGSKKTVSIRGHNVKIPFLMEKDIEDIKFGIKHNVDFIAASFVRKPHEVHQIKDLLEEKGGEHIKIISKIEHASSVENFDEILNLSDAIMVARGDLGVELPLEKVPEIQEMIIRKCREKGKPVIVATQMLESMKEHPRPTRAEVADVAVAILQGTDAIMLSGETASGKYPLKAVQMMTTIAKEYDLKVKGGLIENLNDLDKEKINISLFITNTAYHAARDLKTKAILVPTESGFTARNVSRFRPECPIYTMSREMTVVRQLQLSRGVFPYHSNIKHEKRDIMINELVKIVHDKNKVKENDKIVITAGFRPANKGNTNLIEIYKVKEIIERIKNNQSTL